MTVIPSSAALVAPPNPSRGNSSMPPTAPLQSQRLQNCRVHFWPAPQEEAWVALLPAQGTAELVKEALSLNASAVLVYNASFSEQSFLRNRSGAVVVTLSPVVGAEVAVRLHMGALVYVSLHKTHHNYPTSVNRTSVLFVSVSFILLMIVSLAWLVFYYVQRFRYINAKDRLQRHLSNAAKKALSKIPVKSIKTGDRELVHEECCAVCLEAYTGGDSVRVLPCRHEFHKACVDPWLLDHRTCPMCKMDILRHYGYNLSDSSDSVGNGIIDDDPNVGTNNINNVLTQTLSRAFVNTSSSSGVERQAQSAPEGHAAHGGDLIIAVSADGVPPAGSEGSGSEHPYAGASAPPLASPEDDPSQQSPLRTPPLPSDGGRDTPSPAARRPESFLRAVLETARSRVPFSARGKGAVEGGKLVAGTGAAAAEDPTQSEAGPYQAADNVPSRGSADHLAGRHHSSDEDVSSKSSPVFSVHRAQLSPELCDVDSLDSHEFTDALEHMTPQIIVRSAKLKHTRAAPEELSNSAQRNSNANDKNSRVIKIENLNDGAPGGMTDQVRAMEQKEVADVHIAGTGGCEVALADVSFPSGGASEGCSGGRQDDIAHFSEAGLDDALTLRAIGVPTSPSNTSLFQEAPEPKRRCVTADIRKKSSLAKSEELPGVHGRMNSEAPDSDGLCLQSLESSCEVERNGRSYFHLSEMEENDPTLRDMRPRASAVPRGFTPQATNSRSEERAKSEKRSNVCSVRSSRSIPGLSSYAIPGSAVAVNVPMSRKKSEPELNRDVRPRDQQHRQQSIVQAPIDEHRSTQVVEPPSIPAAANRKAAKPALNVGSNDVLNSRRKLPVASSAADPYCSHQTDLEDLKRRLTILSDQMPLSPEFLPEAGTSTSKSRYQLSGVGVRRSSVFDADHASQVRSAAAGPVLDKSLRKVSKGSKEPRIPSHAISSNCAQKDDRPVANLSESKLREVEMARRRSRRVGPVPTVADVDSSGGDSSFQPKNSSQTFNAKKQPNSKEDLSESDQSNKNVFSVSYA